MTDVLDPIIMNFIYAALGGLMTLTFMLLGCVLFNKIVCNFDIGAELKKGNQAVDMMGMGMFIGIGIGLVIGMGLN